jgi:hypothetical protein
VTITHDDLTREWALLVDAAGIVEIRRRGQRLPVPNGLPVFSTDAADDAGRLQNLHCRRTYDGKHFVLNDPPANVEALFTIGEMFRASYERMKERA